MKRLILTALILSGLIMQTAYAGPSGFQIGTVKCLTNGNTDYSAFNLSFPRFKGIIIDSSTWYFADSSTSSTRRMGYSTNAGTSWGILDRYWSDHGGIMPMHDSILVTSEANFWVVYGSTMRTQRTIPNSDASNFRSVPVADTAANPDSSWVITRDSDTANRNVFGYVSADGGATWSDSIAIRRDDMNRDRIGAITYIGGRPVALIMRGTLAGGAATGELKWVRWNGSAWVCDADSMIIEWGSDISENQRGFAANALINGADSLMMAVWSDGNVLRARWKRYVGGTGAWSEDTLADDNISIFNNPQMYLQISVINYKFVVGYRNRFGGSSIYDSLCFRVFNDNDSTWSDEERVHGYGSIGYPNAPANAGCRGGFFTFTQLLSTANDSLFMVTLTDTTGGSITQPSPITNTSVDSVHNIAGTGIVDTASWSFAKPEQPADSMIYKYGITGYPGWSGETNRVAMAYGAGGAGSQTILIDGAETYTLSVSAWALRIGASPETSSVAQSSHTFYTAGSVKKVKVRD